MTVTRHKRERKKKKVTVSAAARKLDVTREHLSRVLHGHRVSRSLTARYQELLATEEAAR